MMRLVSLTPPGGPGAIIALGDHEIAVPLGGYLPLDPDLLDVVRIAQHVAGLSLASGHIYAEVHHALILEARRALRRAGIALLPGDRAASEDIGPQVLDGTQVLEALADLRQRVAKLERGLWPALAFEPAPDPDNDCGASG